MTNDFWLERWVSGKIGFHQEEVFHKLIEFWPKLPTNSKVLVPLCGKSNDMVWLAEQGYQVTGVELSPLAVMQFLADNDFTFETTQFENGMKVHMVQELPLRIIEGDYFKFQEQGFDACYDRAAMVAIAKPERPNYVKHTIERLTPSAELLLVSLQHDGELNKPPYSVLSQEVIDLWGEKISKISSENLTQLDPQYKARGYDFFEESVWRF
ncbi:thiopurine S-methyltransferase [Marinomonas sp. C2222]|uniref:thiopurine S-methyltransferase n=1 Tax=Marinomonas sargassi TaxID=2984494 RepID=A0ABT2YRP7_9GAMM|nr:thiopurine S-methyltransferase [Marinomonas sargassi]MCV2402568.1 thiopurine S-methyltransferase [Marinomonas sargassi]